MVGLKIFMYYENLSEYSYTYQERKNRKINEKFFDDHLMTPPKNHFSLDVLALGTNYKEN